MSLLNYFCKRQLIEHYTHIGFKKNQTHHVFRSVLLGFHHNVSIINPVATFSRLIFFSRMLLKLMLKNQKVCFILFNIPQSYSLNQKFSKQFFFFNMWPAGLLTNYLNIKLNKNLTKSYYFLQLPSALVLYGLEPSKLFSIVNEANILLLPSFSFVDSDIDPSFLPYWIPTNTKSGYSKLFFLRFFQKISERAVLSKKNIFFLKAIKKSNIKFTK